MMSTHNKHLRNTKTHSNLLGVQMFRPLTQILFLLTFTILVGLSHKAVAEEEKSVGKVIAIIGSVDYLSGENEPVAETEAGQVRKVSLPAWQKVGRRQPVFTQDQFRTSRKSRLRVLFEDSSLIALGPNATMKVAHYLYKPEEKLRESVISVAHGLSMYIVNKSQTNKNSSFKIVSPTAAMSARGTHGYMSVSGKKSLIANVAGSVEVINSDLSVVGKVVVGAMMKTIVEKGQPPTPPEPLTAAELKIINNVVIGLANSEDSTEEENKKKASEEEYDEFEDEVLDSCTSG